MGQNSLQDAIHQFLRLCRRWYLPSTTHLLAKFGPQTLYMYVFVENETIISWAISKWSTNTETDISRYVHFQLYHTYSRPMEKKTLWLSAKV